MQGNAEASSPPPPAPGTEQHALSPSGEETRRKYKGVRRRKSGSWASEIRLSNSRRRICLDSHHTPEKAARAFDAAFVCLRGSAAADGGLLNFPDSRPPAVSQTTIDACEVYAAAVAHANNAASSRAAAGQRDDEATDQPEPEEHDGVQATTNRSPATVPAPLQVPTTTAEAFDSWSEMVANPPPLYSPTTVPGSDAHHLPLVSPTSDEDESSACPGLWSFHSDDGRS